MRTDLGLCRQEELAGFDPKGRGERDDVGNPGVDRRGLDALEVPQIDGGPLCEFGLGQFLVEPEAADVRRDAREGGVQQVLVHPRAVPSTPVLKNGRSAVFR